MKIRILLLTMLPVICLAQVNPNGEKPAGELLSKEISPNEMKRNASFNVEEIKVRWKKAALENCTGVPCVAAPSFTCGTSTISDIDGNVYETVSIGTQCWTKTNLKVTKYNDGDEIPDSTNSTWGTATIGARTGYDVSVVSLNDYVGTFGYLYNWYAATDSRKLCPDGWHVPTDSDWNKLVRSIHSGADTSSTSLVQSTSAGKKLKKNDALLWLTNTGTDDLFFSALPGGGRGSGGSSYSINSLAWFWSATQSSPSVAWIRLLDGGTDHVIRNNYNDKGNGFSVRCLKD